MIIHTVLFQACNFHLLTNTGTFTILMKTSSKRSKRRDPHPCDTDIVRQTINIKAININITIHADFTFFLYQVHLFFNENVYETRRSYENNAGT